MDDLSDRIMERTRQMLRELPEEETGYKREKVAAGLKQVREEDPELSSKQVMVALRHAITGRKVSPKQPILHRSLVYSSLHL
jgi:3-methyladenine DNA glycosylase AlkC